MDTTYGGLDKMKLSIYGPWIGGTSGYANHTRDLSNALAQFGLDISILCQKPEQWQRGLTDVELKMHKTIHRACESFAIYVGLPHSNKGILSERHKKFVQYVVWEGDKIPKCWIESLLDKRIDQIWCPSYHTKNAIENTLLEVDEDILETIMSKVRIVPHGVDKSVFYPNKDKSTKPVDEKDKFVFIANKGWRHDLDRGGIQYLVKAYAEEFTSKDNVELILKLNPAYGTKTQEQLQILIGSLAIENQDKPTLKVVQAELTREQLRGLYNESNVFVSSTMAESFNLPGLEAMACAVPNLQTNFGGQTDYMTKDNSYILRTGEMIEVKWDTMYEGIQWFKPNVMLLRKQLRWCYDNKENVRAKGLSALNDSSDWTWLRAALKAKVFLDELKQ